MQLFSKNSKAIVNRRDSVRKHMASHQRQNIWRRVFRLYVWLGLAFAIICWLAASSFSMLIREESKYTQGEMLTRDITARVAFETVDEQETLNRRESLRRLTPAIYELNQGYLKDWRRFLETLPTAIGDIQEPENLDGTVSNRLPLSKDAITSLRYYQNNSGLWALRVEAYLEAISELAIVRHTDYERDALKHPSSVQLRNEVLSQKSPPQDIVSHLELLDVSKRQEVQGRLIRKARSVGLSASLAEAIAEGMTRSEQPIYLRDDTESLARKDAAIANAEVQKVLHEKSDLLIPAGTILEIDDLKLLQSENHAYELQADALTRWAPWAGVFIVNLLIISAMIGHTITTSSKITRNPLRGLVILIMMLCGLPLAWVLSVLSPYFDIAGPLLPLGFASITLTIAYGQRYALGMSLLYAGLLSIAMNLPLAMCIVLGIASTLAVAQLGDLRQRSTLIRVGGICGIVAAIGVWGAGATQGYFTWSYAEILGYRSIFALFSCLAVGFIVLGSLPLIEQLFRVTTSMTLLELCDVSQPILRKLAETAPGTYHHSLNISVMSEKAAESIGCNGLLCRVGALYHDIGKMNKPEYFIENQGGGPNKHDKLSPAMSLLVIVGHVKDGMQMAREAGLPKSLWHFIESHHGTTLVEYFFYAARERRAEDQQPSEVEFRYPGPKPKTREAAIMMLCDCAESASRTLNEPTAPRIEQMVHSLTMKRLMDGQFEDCSMTLQELNAIEQSIVKSLCSIYHSRIKYPKQSESQDQTQNQLKKEAI